MIIKNNIRFTFGTLLMGGLICCALFSGCNSKKSSGNENLVLDDSIPLPSIISELSTDIKEEKVSSFANKIDYPLERPYPLHNIQDSAEMVEYYSTLIDDSIKTVITRSSRSDWAEVGWRGWTLDAGQYLWIDDKIYSFPYMSKKERELLKKEKKMEMESLPSDMRDGWEPEYCLISESDNTIYRIDSDSVHTIYRLSVYPKGKNLHKHPQKIWKGKMHTEGSENNRRYEFKDKSGSQIEFLRDDSGDGLSIILIPKDSKETSISVNPTYWLDQLNQDTTQDLNQPSRQ